jgi:hypothetical protein
MQSMKTFCKIGAIAAVALFAATGCNKTTDNTANYKSAINAFYSTNMSCLYSQPAQFPQKADASNASDIAPLNALYDQGLLTRKADEERILLVVHKQVNIYDLTDKGRAAWTADAQQPGFGNFCYGHRSVSSIDSSTQNTGKPGATTTVAYHYTLDGVPDWAKATETQTAFPKIAAALAGGQGTANLVDTSNGWQVQP